tara:strand:- start:268 stop:444 length:177 start_codon:yes stop_codon:yes gene_type:complete
VNKQIFTKQFLDSMSSFIYSYIKEKAKTKANIKKSIHIFETVWLEMLRESRKDDKRKI